MIPPSCPYCGHAIILGNVTTGRFTMPCAGCREPYALVITAEADTHHFEVVALRRLPAATRLPKSSGAAAAQTKAPTKSMTPILLRPRIPKSPGGLPSRAVPLKPRTATALPETHLAPETASKQSAPASEADIPWTLGGYEIERKIGQGGMGSVYLARQISLDRQVAVKVLNPELASDAELVARFIREAYAAAQLSHHNVVQIHDIGVRKDVHFFSMELIEGDTLGKLLRGAGRLDPTLAVGYTLQAARGLAFAHDRGLIHRDIKPDNLLLNDHGIVKVADLGLVKQVASGEKSSSRTDGSDPAAMNATRASVAMGTPPYMSPEQARDAAHVDHRADIYSLGCSLYDLLTGKPPFTGATVMEILTKHAREPLIPPDRVVKHVPPALSAIVMKMTAKRTEDRHASMSDVISALEGFLGLDSGKPFTPGEEHVKVLEIAVDAFNQSRWAKFRLLLTRGFFTLCGVAALICAIPSVGHPSLVGGFSGLALMTFFFHEFTAGLTQRTYLFQRFRALVFSSRFVDWLGYAAGVAVLILLLVILNLHWVWMGFALLAAGLAIGFHFSLDLMVAREQDPPLKQVEQMLRSMRLKGLDENAIRQFVCIYSGREWENFFEALFGYEAKLAARSAWGKGERGKNRPKRGAWRDGVLEAIEQRIRLRLEARERRMLACVEARALAKAGIDERDTARKARQKAARLVEFAADFREASKKAALHPSTSRGGFEVRPLRFDAMRDTTSGGRRRRHNGVTPLNFLFGRRVRLAMAAVILIGFGMWWNSNQPAVEPIPSPLAAAVADSHSLEAAGEKTLSVVTSLTHRASGFDQPLRVPGVPRSLCNAVGSWNGGLAGALLLVSIFFGGDSLGLLVVAGAMVALFGRCLPVPLGAARTWISAACGAAIAGAGILFRRS